MVRVLRPAAVPLVLVLLIGLSGLALSRIYAGPVVAQLMAGAGLGAVAVSVAARRLPGWAPAPLSVLLLAGYAWVALWWAADRSGLAEPLPALAADAAGNGIPRLLTAMIPIEATPDTVLVPVVAAWIAGLAGAETAVRGGRVLLGCLPAVGLYGGALYVVGPNAAPGGWHTVAFAALVGVALAATGRRDGAGGLATGRRHGADGLATGRRDGVDGPAATGGAAAASRGGTGCDTDPTDGAAAPPTVPAATRLRSAAAATASVGAVLALAAVVGPWVAGRITAAPVDPRRYVQPPIVDGLDESPLNRISGWALNPRQRLLEVSARPAPGADGSATGDVADGSAAGNTADGSAAGNPDGDGAAPAVRLRLAVLPDYDGITWRIGATYRSAGRVLPEAPVLPGARVDRIHQEITVAELTGRLLPVVPDPMRVEGARVAFDPDSGTLLRPEGLTPGLRYTVTSARQVPDLNLLPAADVPSGPAVARYLQVGAGVPEPIEGLAEQLATDNGAPYDRAAAIEQFLAEHYRLAGDAPSGHAYPNLSFFLFGPRQAGGQQGTSEQFAAAFAVLGRLAGLPTRVVVGFRVPAAGGPITAGDAYAWPEVLFDELGWVAFDPRPDPGGQPRPVEEDFKPEPERTPPPSQPPGPPDEPDPPAVPPAAVAPPPAGPGGVAVTAGIFATVLASVVLAALVTGLLRRFQTARRLRGGPPARRVAGAWLEFTDALRLAGRPAAAHLAATEVADHAGAMAGGLPSVPDLVAGVNETTFAPASADGALADRAVAQAVGYAAALRARRRWWRRLWWSVHPGPLRWHRTGRAGAAGGSDPSTGT